MKNQILKGNITPLTEEDQKRFEEIMSSVNELPDEVLEQVGGGFVGPGDGYDYLRAAGMSEEDIIQYRLEQMAYDMCRTNNCWGNCDKWNEYYFQLANEYLNGTLVL